MAAPNPRFDNIPNNVEVGEASSSVAVEYWKKELMIKFKCPLPPRQPTTTPLSPPENSRMNQNLDMAIIEYELIQGRKLDVNLDNKELRRTMSNRLSAQRSRIKRSQYKIDMEKKVKDLEVLVASLMPQLESCNEKKRQLQLENISLRQLLDVRVQEAKIAEGKLEEIRQEIRDIKEGRITKKEEVRPKPYSIEFYQERLMQLEMNQFITQQLSAQPQQFDDDDDDDDDQEQEDEEVDQYLNLEDHELDLHQDDNVSQIN